MNYTIISETTFEKVRNKIKEVYKKNPEARIVFFSNDDELNRKVLEKEKIAGLLLSQSIKKDRQKQRDSGLNQVLAKLCKKNNVFIGINLDEIVKSQGEKKEKILARVKQNIKICNKYKVQMKFIAQNTSNERNIYDLKSLGLVLGMPTWMTKRL